MQPAPDTKKKSWALLPGSMVSVAIHGVVLLIASYSLQGCENGVPAEAGGRDFRNIGLATLPDSSEPTDERKEQPQDDNAEQPAEQVELNAVKPALPTEAPDIADLLNQNSTSDAEHQDTSESPSIIGAGQPENGLPSAGTGIPELIRPRRASPGAGAAGSLTPGPNATSFMNIVGNGRSFVYVIDTSSSMSSGGRMNLAKSQLKGSLRLLKPSQKFQVLFYNEFTTPMKLRNRPAQDLYAATEVQVLLAEKEIDGVTAFSGTEHLQPILHALRLEPDVIYFLTDGTQPRLTASDLAKIRRSNRSGASIHVIEFASGAKESRELSWLQLLASQSRGKYNYVPVQ